MNRKYTVDISSYDAFRKATFGKLYDVDSAFGHQCWDAAALLWIQLTPPRNLSSGGTGAARGCWEVVSARNINAGTEFELITDVTKIKRGDIIVFGTGLGKYGHIGFTDEDFDPGKSIIATYSQNQGGTAGQGQAAAFSVVSYRTSALIGAFRFKAWQTQRETRYRIVINHPTKEIADIALDELIKTGFNTARQEQSGGKFKTVVYGNETFTNKSRAEKGVDTVKSRGYNAVIEEC
jgi:hypothetical protein